MRTRPRITPNTDAYGCPFVREFGETRRPIRARYGLGERAVFDDMARCLIDDPTVQAMLSHVYGAGMSSEDAMTLLVEGVSHARADLSRVEVLAYVHEVVPRLLGQSEAARLRTNGKTARDISRAARRERVRSLRSYRR